MNMHSSWLQHAGQPGMQVSSSTCCSRGLARARQRLHGGLARLLILEGRDVAEAAGGLQAEVAGQGWEVWWGGQHAAQQPAEPSAEPAAGGAQQGDQLRGGGSRNICGGGLDLHSGARCMGPVRTEPGECCRQCVLADASDRLACLQQSTAKGWPFGANMASSLCIKPSE